MNPEQGAGGSAPPGWHVVRDLRWAVARGTLLDPMVWIGTVIATWAAGRAVGLAPAGTLAAQLAPACFAVALILAGASLGRDLLFDRPENDLLRTLPMGPTGLLQVRRAEVGWWTTLPAIVTASLVWGIAGPAAGLGVLVAPRLGAAASCRLAVAAAKRPRLLGSGALGSAALPLGARIVPPIGPTWVPLVLLGLVLGAAVLLGRGGEAAFLAHYEGTASQLRARSRRPRGAAWRILERVLPLPAPLRARVLRDLVLLADGRDGRGLALLLLSPLAFLMLFEAGSLPASARLPWTVLSAAALGGVAVAWAAGPGIHAVRGEVLSWERLAPRPGQRALTASLLYGLGFALLHGVGLLAVVALAEGGRHAALVPSLVLPVLILEASLAHFVVVSIASTTDGRRAAGEGTLVLSLPIVAVAVALAGALAPWALPVYFLVTIPMARQAAARLDTVDVTW